MYAQSRLNVPRCKSERVWQKEYKEKKRGSTREMHTCIRTSAGVYTETKDEM